MFSPCDLAGANDGYCWQEEASPIPNGRHDFRSGSPHSRIQSGGETANNVHCKICSYAEFVVAEILTTILINHDFINSYLH